MQKAFEQTYKRLEERKNNLFQKIISIADTELQKIDELIDSISAVKERSITMFQPIQSTSAIGYARSLERIIDFTQDFKGIQLPHKLTNDFRVNLCTLDELLKGIEKLGTIETHNVNDNHLESKLLITNDFAKPKNKLIGSKIVPEIA